ncbi:MULTISPECIES: cupredoxin domain-containing protein [Amycolatopsis]|uniref:Cupredoxin domain-containing protein n=1 Tax=Amycolatopsis albidoflavus TaxID=102226 RepID=A0ABW5I322_9PSEU
MKRFLVLFAAVVLLTLAAPVTASAAAAQTVMMQDYAYSPASLTVHVGDTVTWIQHDTAPHDVVTTSAPVAFRSPQLSQGQTWNYTFRTPGTYSYYCSVHPDMRAQVIVQPAATQPPSPPRTTSAAPASRAAPSRTAVAAPPVVPTATTPPSTVATSAMPSQSAVPSTSAAASPVAQAAATTSLDPKLLVAGLVTAVAIGCLLLLSSRKA